MSQLFTQRGAEYLPWSNGAALFFTSHESGGRRLIVAVNCRMGDLEETDLALLDTGAEWSVIGGELVEILEDFLGSPTEEITMSTRFGHLHGHLRRLEIHLLADPGLGSDLDINGTVFVARDWPGPIVLGFRGFLERLRFALDPGSGAENEETIYFGAS